MSCARHLDSDPASDSCPTCATKRLVESGRAAALQHAEALAEEYRRKPTRSLAQSLAEAEHQASVSASALMRPEWISPDEHATLESNRRLLTRPDLSAAYERLWDDYELAQTRLAQATARTSIAARASELALGVLSDQVCNQLEEAYRTAVEKRQQLAAPPWPCVRKMHNLVADHRFRDACSMAAARWVQRRRRAESDLSLSDNYWAEALSMILGAVVFFVMRSTLVRVGINGTDGPLPWATSIAAMFAVMSVALFYPPRARARSRRVLTARHDLSEAIRFEHACQVASLGGPPPPPGALNSHELSQSKRGLDQPLEPAVDEERKAMAEAQSRLEPFLNDLPQVPTATPTGDLGNSAPPHRSSW